MNEADRLLLEQIIDRTTLAEVLSAIAEICGEKAEHIRVNWQDRFLAKTWDDDAQRVSKAAEAVRNTF